TVGSGGRPPPDGAPGVAAAPPGTEPDLPGPPATAPPGPVPPPGSTGSPVSFIDCEASPLPAFLSGVVLASLPLPPHAAAAAAAATKTSDAARTPSRDMDLPTRAGIIRSVMARPSP